jgi:hypothetical protein
VGKVGMGVGALMQNSATKQPISWRRIKKSNVLATVLRSCFGGPDLKEARVQRQLRLHHTWMYSIIIMLATLMLKYKIVDGQLDD